MKSYEFLFDMLPFMFVAPPPLLVFVRVFEFDMFEFDMFELLMLLFDIFELPEFVVLMFELPEFVVLIFPFDKFELLKLLFDMFAFVFVLSAGEQAVQTPATVSKARRAKVLRIEFPPEPSKVGQSLGEPRGLARVFRRIGSAAARCFGFELS